MRLAAGDVIEMSSKQKKSYALMWAGFEDDYGLGLIRIDGYTRNNIGVGLDDTIAITKTRAQEAQQVVLAPTEELNIAGRLERS